MRKKRRKASYGPLPKWEATTPPLLPEGADASPNWLPEKKCSSLHFSFDGFEATFVYSHLGSRGGIGAAYL